MSDEEPVEVSPDQIVPDVQDAEIEPIAEDSMEAPDFSPKPEGKLVNAIQSDVSAALSQLINLNEDNIYHEPTCHVCNSPYRALIERTWTDTKSYDRVREVMKQKTGTPVLSDEVIDNHIINHFSRGTKELQKIEYLNKINRLNGVNITTLDRINMGLSAITVRLMELNSLTPTADTSLADIEKLKSAETARLMGTFNQLLKMQSGLLGEMKADGEIITIPTQQFVGIFNDTILNARTDGERAIIKSLLSKLTDLSKFAQ